MGVVHLDNKNANLELSLHSGIAHMTYKLDAIAVKTWFYLVARVFHYLEETQDLVFSLPAKDLFDYLGTRNYSHIKEILESIRQTGLAFNSLGKDPNKNWLTISLLSAVGIQDGEVIFEIPAFLKKKLLEFKEMFVVINLMLLRDFRSKYSLALYVVFTDYLIKDLKQTEKIMTIDELRKLLDISKNEYAEYKAFNRDVLKKAVSEINSKSNIFVTYKPHKTFRRKIISLKFTFKVVKSIPQPDVQDKLVLKDLPIDSSKQISSLKDSQSNKKILPTDKKVLDFLIKHNIALNISKHQERIKEIGKHLDHDELNNYFLYLVEITNAKKHEIKEDSFGKKNIGGFFIGCLRSDDYLAGFFIEVDKRRKKREEQEEQIQKVIEKKVRDTHRSESESNFLKFLENDFTNHESTFIRVLEEIGRKNSFAYNYAVVKKNKGKIDKNILSNKLILSILFKDYSEKFEYTPIPFEIWEKGFRNTVEGKDKLRSFESEAKDQVLKG